MHPFDISDDKWPAEFRNEIVAHINIIKHFTAPTVSRENTPWHYVIDSEGDLYCSGNNLDSLQGCPSIINGDFSCDSNRLTSLEFAPQYVSGAYSIDRNSITSLEGIPKFIFKEFDCSLNALSNLTGGPVWVSGNYNTGNNSLTSLVGAPDAVGNFYCANNRLSNFEGLPTKIVGQLNMSGNKITSLQGIHKHFKNGFIAGDIYIDVMHSHILGLILIPGLTEVNLGLINVNVTNTHSSTIFCFQMFRAIEIINNHLEGDRDVIDCQQDLINAGFKALAQL